jgi:hexosaminidase
VRAGPGGGRAGAGMAMTTTLQLLAMLLLDSAITAVTIPAAPVTSTRSPPPPPVPPPPPPAGPSSQQQLLPVWPLPRAVSSSGSDTAQLLPNKFTLHAHTGSAALSGAFVRFQQRAFPHVVVASPPPPPSPPAQQQQEEEEEEEEEREDGTSCCTPGGSFLCTGPCFVNGTVVQFSERDELAVFGPGRRFLNYSINNTETSFTEHEVYTRPSAALGANGGGDECQHWTGATMQRSDAPSGGQVVLETLYFTDDCNSFSKVVAGQLPSPVICQVTCKRDGNGGAGMAPPMVPQQPIITGLVVTVVNTSVALGLGVNESYQLAIPRSGMATLSAPTLYGAFHGLETLSQLIHFNFTTERYSIVGRVLPLVIADEPSYDHRGLLLDTARHFQPVPALLRVIDSMAMAKLNTFHWHISDDQSWPAASHAFPELAESGAWSESERYTWHEMQTVVEFGRQRGVRVIPEWDMPGHASSWRASHPELFSEGARADCGTQIDGAPPNTTRGALDPAKNATFDFIEAFLKDYYYGGGSSGGVFQDDFVHLGADEVPTACWTNAIDQKFIAQQGLVGGSAGLFSYFVRRVHEIATKRLGRRVIMWDAAFNKGSEPPPKDVVIQMWLQYGTTNNLLLEIVRAGYSAIASPDIPWYLNVVEPKDAACNTQWQCIYNYDPRAGLTAAEATFVLGGEGCLWGETVDPSDLESTLWPRLAAVAERLWTGGAVNITGQPEEETAMEGRLRRFRCLLLHRGFSPGVVGDTVGDPSVPEWQRLHGPPAPGSCTQDIAKPHILM